MVDYFFGMITGGGLAMILSSIQEFRKGRKDKKEREAFIYTHIGLHDSCVVRIDEDGR